MRFVVACLFAVCLADSFISEAVADDLKSGVTDLAHVDADYHLQGEYAGGVLFSDGYTRNVGLQVVAQGDAKFDALWYQGGLPGGGYDGTARRKLNGKRSDSMVELIGEGLTIELRTETAAIVKSSAGGLIGSLIRQLRHSVTEGAAPPANAVVLFDGKNVDRLKNARITADGLLEVGAETKEPVQSFTLHAEFRTPYMPYARGQGRGNSGFYLQKRYEVQVLDSFGLELQNNDCASLYKFKAPDVNMSFPPLQWQTYDIDFTAPRFDASGQRVCKGHITVRHNGVVVHCNLDLENKTGGGTPEGPNPLPILLQNHGNPIHFRNLWLISHETAPSAYPAAIATADCGGATAVCSVPAARCRHQRLRRCR